MLSGLLRSHPPVREQLRDKYPYPGTTADRPHGARNHHHRGRYLEGHPHTTPVPDVDPNLLMVRHALRTDHSGALPTGTLRIRRSREPVERSLKAQAGWQLPNVTT
ncbi:hypothetical protein SGFS_103900 [Streptomyces graminofaciens]|uniref:Uncharacterized protein n=1 Tax=Streptomyces graminofaciens TaxID=68212 RepID=A0ABM7FPM9_9ACTN|nr:hypothetical protein SGFS_103900 [Streptomyces graminofaciens]